MNASKTTCLIVKSIAVSDIVDDEIVLAGVKCVVKKGKLIPLNEKLLRVTEEINSCINEKNGVVIIKKENNNH